MGNEELTKILTRLLNKIRETCEIHLDWKILGIILIAKKGDRHKIENYRPITLHLTVVENFSKILQNRIRSLLDKQEPAEQAGFRKAFSIIDHLHTIGKVGHKNTVLQKLGISPFGTAWTG